MKKEICFERRGGKLTLRVREIAKDEIKACPDRNLAGDGVKVTRIRSGNTVYGTREFSE